MPAGFQARLNPSIAPISRSLHAQRPIRGLPGGALCVSRLAAGGTWLRDCCGRGLVLDQLEFSSPRCVELAPVCCGHGCLADLGKLGFSDLASCARWRVALGPTGCARRRIQRRLDVDRPDSFGAKGFERDGALAGSARSNVVALSRARYRSEMGLGGAEQTSGAMGRSAPRPGGEPRLKAVCIARAAAAAGHASLRCSTLTPWGIFPRA